MVEDGATAHIVREMAEGVVGSRHGATAHMERDGDGVAGRTMARPYTLREMGKEWQVAPWCDRTLRLWERGVGA